MKFDYVPNKIALTDLLDYYFAVIDPLSVNRQGNDVGVLSILVERRRQCYAT